VRDEATDGARPHRVVVRLHAERPAVRLPFLPQGRRPARLHVTETGKGLLMQHLEPQLAEPVLEQDVAREQATSNAELTTSTDANGFFSSGGHQSPNAHADHVPLDAPAAHR